MEGLGTTVDCVLVNGMLREGDRIVICGLGGAIVSRIKALKTPMVSVLLVLGCSVSADSHSLIDKLICGLDGVII